MKKVRALEKDQGGMSDSVVAPFIFLFGVIICVVVFEMFMNMRAEAAVSDWLRTSTRLVSSSGGDCGKYRPQTLTNADGSCPGPKGSATGGMSVSEYMTDTYIRNTIRYAYFVDPSTGIVCQNGGPRVGATAGDRKQTSKVGDIVSCQLTWNYPATIFKHKDMNSYQVGTSEVGTLIDKP